VLDEPSPVQVRNSRLTLAGRPGLGFAFSG
jgi:hypothetical protein